MNNFSSVCNSPTNITRETEQEPRIDNTIPVNFSPNQNDFTKVEDKSTISRTLKKPSVVKQMV